MKKTLFLIASMLFCSGFLSAQVSVNLDGTPAHSSAMLDVSSGNRGFLLPRMNMDAIIAISNPATGLMVYNTDDNNFFVNRGAPATPDWWMVNSKWRAEGPNIYFTGQNVGIGWQFPIARLDIRGSNPDDGSTFQLSNSDLSHRLLLFGGRENDHDPFINWKQGDALKFMTDEGAGSEKMRITSDGRVGIGTDSCTALLHVNGTGTGGGNVLFVGEYKTWAPGDPPVEGEGTRMMWYPDQAVFRVGAVSGDRWDSLYLGPFSTAIGYNCIASGSVSFSLGSYTLASNTCSVAIGHGAWSTAYAATALGYSTLASGYATTAMGDNTVAQAYVSTAIGQYNVGSGTENTWVETDPIFEIGIGPGWLNRKNAMTVLKNGHVGIGTITPESGLHVAANGWPGSFVYLEAGEGSDAGLRFYESTTPKWHIFNDASVGGLMIQNNATTPVIYCNQSNGYVGIKTDAPTQALHVVGDAYKTLGGNTWAASSDLRLKELLGNYTKGLDEITALQPVVFVYKENNTRQLPINVEQVGFVAQDVQKVFPEAVSEAEDGYLDFNIHAINVALVNAVKELNQKVELQQKEIDELKALVSSILASQTAQLNE